jgi:hypothetical protein
MTAHYATSFQSDNFAATYRDGLLVIVRLKDQISVTLTLHETNEFRIWVQNYELADDDRDPIDRACARYVMRMKKRKWIYAQFGGSVIAFHNEPLGVKP